MEQELYSYGCCTCFIPFSPMGLLVKGSGTWKKPTGRTLSYPLSLPDFVFLSEWVLTSLTVHLTPHPPTPQQVAAFLGLTGRFLKSFPALNVNRRKC